MTNLTKIDILRPYYLISFNSFKNTYEYLKIDIDNCWEKDGIKKCKLSNGWVISVTYLYEKKPVRTQNSMKREWEQMFIDKDNSFNSFSTQKRLQLK